MPTRPDDITFIGETTFRGMGRPFGIRREDRRRHMYVVGKTGTGKSTLLEHLIRQDIQRGEGVAIIDPHGDLIERLVAAIPPARRRDLIYFDPGNAGRTLAFNVLEVPRASQRHLIASGLISVFKKIWADSWGPRLEYILRHTILALLYRPGATLMDVPRMYTDTAFRAEVVESVADPVVRAFWQEEFAAYSPQFRNEAVAPIQNKIGQFLAVPLIRNVIGRPRSSFDLRQVMDDRRIFLANLSKGKLGEDSSALLGAMLVTKLQLAAMSRIDLLEDDRRDFYLYVDEFQNFATDSFAAILSEARKYRLNLTLAHQYIGQLEEDVRDAVFGNVGSILVFRVGAADAKFLAPEFEPEFSERDLTDLPAFEIYLRLAINGLSSRPFSARTLAPAALTLAFSRR